MQFRNNKYQEMMRQKGLIKAVILFAGLFFTVSGYLARGGLTTPQELSISLTWQNILITVPVLPTHLFSRLGYSILLRSCFGRWETWQKQGKRFRTNQFQLVAFRSEEKILHTQVLYVNKVSGFNLNKVKTKLEGHQTMLITEGYEFRESMINFVAVNGHPKFEANEDLIKKAGMSVNSNFLAQRNQNQGRLGESFCDNRC